MMNCNNVRTRLVAWQDEELSPGEHVLVGEHLDRCAECRALEKRLARVTPEPFANLDPRLEREMWSRLDRALDEAANSPPPPVVAVRKPGWRDFFAAPFEMPFGVALAWGAALGFAVVWGASNWLAARELEATLARRAAPDAGVTTADSGSLPADQYRPASWTPEADQP
jgi:anti-sigma factor RsiW